MCRCDKTQSHLTTRISLYDSSPLLFFQYVKGGPYRAFISSWLRWKLTSSRNRRMRVCLCVSSTPFHLWPGKCKWKKKSLSKKTHYNQAPPSAQESNLFYLCAAFLLQISWWLKMNCSFGVGTVHVGISEWIGMLMTHGATRVESCPSG